MMQGNSQGASPYAALLAMLQGGQGAQGFTQPGQGLMNNGVPQLTPFTGGGAGGGAGAMPPPSMPQGATAQPNSGASGMFGSLANNPMMMAMLAKQMQGGQPNPMTTPVPNVPTQANAQITPQNLAQGAASGAAMGLPNGMTPQQLQMLISQRFPFMGGAGGQ